MMPLRLQNKYMKVFFSITAIAQIFYYGAFCFEDQAAKVKAYRFIIILLYIVLLISACAALSMCCTETQV